MFKGKNVLVAGGSGLIGRQLVDLLLKEEANVLVCDLNKTNNKNIDQMSLDLTVYDNCLKATSGMDYVFNLLCAKGSPKAMKERPASHFVPMILFDTNLMRAAKEKNVKRYMYSSTLGVYAPAEIFFEEDVWKTFPSKNDRFAGWAKRMGELQTEAYEIQYGWDEISIVRPANTYGPYDNFNTDSAMVVPSLVKKVLSGKDEIVAWGDGSNIRDFIHSKDVAMGMLEVMRQCPGPSMPINLGSGTGYSIKELITTIVKHSGLNPKIVWDTSKPSGDIIRILDTSRAKKLGINPKISLEEGIKDLIDWYVNSEINNE
tara:strand:- start:1050 stop:1997 length:948 start_codon:yes stop_codon:yes gene_type:complete